MSSSRNHSGPPVPFDVQQDYERHLAKGYGINATTGQPIDPGINTKKGYQLDGTKNLREAASRLADGEGVLKDNLNIIQDPRASKKDKKMATVAIKKLGTLMSVASNKVVSAANVVSPIAGTGPAHQRMQNIRERELKKPKSPF